MNRKIIISTIFGALFFVSLIITIIYGINFGRLNNKIRKEQGVYTTVEIQKINSSYNHYKENKSGRKTYDYTAYNCDISYMYDNEQLSQESVNFDARNKYLREGDTKKLYIDKNTKKVMNIDDYTGDKRFKFFGLVLVSVVLFLT